MDSLIEFLLETNRNATAMAVYMKLLEANFDDS